MKRPTTLAQTMTTDPYDRIEQMQPTLDCETLEELSRLGERRRVEVGEVLFDVGDQQTNFIVVLSGMLAIESETCEEVETIVEHGRGAFTGEIDMFSNRRAIVRGVCREAGDMLFLSRQQFRRFLSTHASLSEIIIRAFILRRMGLLYHELGDLTLIGSVESDGMLSLRTFLARNGHPHKVVDPDRDEELAGKLVRHFSLTPDDLPAVVYRNRDVLKRPDARAVADLIGLSEGSCETGHYDVAIVGTGPSGLAAAVNAASEGLSVIALERLAPGGQAGTSSKIENYPAFPTGITGQALGARMMLQAQKFGAEILAPREVVGMDCDGHPVRLNLADGGAVTAEAVVIATGAKWRRLGLDGEDRLENAGLYYGATPMEAALCQDQEVAIVGGGNSAGQAAVFLATQARHVHILVRGDELASSMSDYLIRRIEADENITLHTGTEVVSVEGETHLERQGWCRNGEEEMRDIRHLFVMIGAIPNTDWLEGCLLLDDKGFIRTGSDLPPEHLVSRIWNVNRMPFIGETSRPGVFAVGDVRSGSVKRVASAVGEGAISAQFLYKVVHPEH
jgi:thioredoxin reductase (NADPH)